MTSRFRFKVTTVHKNGRTYKYLRLVETLRDARGAVRRREISLDIKSRSGAVGLLRSLHGAVARLEGSDRAALLAMRAVELPLLLAGASTRSLSVAAALVVDQDSDWLGSLAKLVLDAEVDLVLVPSAWGRRQPKVLGLLELAGVGIIQIAP